jgi:hypothetical protein
MDRLEEIQQKYQSGNKRWDADWLLNIARWTDKYDKIPDAYSGRETPQQRIARIEADGPRCLVSIEDLHWLIGEVETLRAYND